MAKKGKRKKKKVNLQKIVAIFLLLIMILSYGATLFFRF